MVSYVFQNINCSEIHSRDVMHMVQGERRWGSLAILSLRSRFCYIKCSQLHFKSTKPAEHFIDGSFVVALRAAVVFLCTLPVSWEHP